MNKSNNIWNRFAEKHPSASKWIREGGLFVIVSNLITVLKYVMLLFLPLAFAGLPNIDFGFPGIDITLFGETFKWNIIGYDAAHGGLPYFLCIHDRNACWRVHQLPNPEKLCIPQ